PARRPAITCRPSTSASRSASRRRSPGRPAAGLSTPVSRPLPLGEGWVRAYPTAPKGVTMEPWKLTDAFTGATGTGTFDPNDPLTLFTVAGRSAENSGTEGLIPGWSESRYFASEADYAHYRRWRNDTRGFMQPTGDDIVAWFISDEYKHTQNGRWWTEW